MKQGGYPENMPILYRNALDSMPSDYARAAWLWAIEQPGMDAMVYKADAFALEANRVANFNANLLEIADRVNARLKTGLHLHQSQKADLVDFIERRRANWRLGSNKNPSYSWAKTTRGKSNGT